MTSLIRIFQLTKKKLANYVQLHPWGCGVLTDDAEDSQDVGSEYHQYVDEAEQDDSDGDVAQPAEGFGGEQHLLDGSPHLRAHTGPTGAPCQNPFSLSSAPNKPSTNLQGRARWGRSASRRWGRPLARTGSMCHRGRSGCKCAAARPPLHLD